MTSDRVDTPPGSANRLAAETSPYLLQHASNPVDWYPWGEAAFDRAWEEDRPVLLSVGYSACHWCHVMERESFENAHIAALMNEHFVNVKVDREERPDVDEIYMAAVQAMTGSGGWPMTVFLTPDRRPFYGGTYFPPDDRHGRPGFPRVLRAVAEHYRSHRDRVEDQAERLRSFLAQNADPLRRSERIGEGILEGAYRQLRRGYDERYGGFSGSGPKFPNSAGLSLLLRHWHDGGEPEALRMVTHTLTRMARGGVYDHLGGGFHRYSVDERWLVPHFEKMLYDNALLVPVYVDAFQATGEELFASVVRQTLDYLVREMTAPDGGYCATQDADSEGEEGRFFVWTPEQVEGVIADEEQARLLCRYFDVTPEGNFEGGQSILHVQSGAGELARFLGVEPRALEAAVAAGRLALFERRAQRVAPGRDDKVIVSWNGLALTAMVRGYQALGEERYLESARAAAAFLLDALVVDGRLRHGYRDGAAPLDAYQDDYAALANGLVDLYEATFEGHWLARAQDLAREMIERFWDGLGDGGFFFVGPGREDLLVRTKNPFDGATPSGNSMAVMLLLRLGALTGDAALTRHAEDALKVYASPMESSPAAVPFMICALHQYGSGPCEVTVTGHRQRRRPFLDYLHARYVPNRVVSGCDPRGVGEEELALVPSLRDRLGAHADGEARAYVCRHSVCSPPAARVDEFAAALAPAVRGWPPAGDGRRPDVEP